MPCEDAMATGDVLSMPGKADLSVPNDERAESAGPLLKRYRGTVIINHPRGANSFDFRILGENSTRSRVPAQPLPGELRMMK